MTARTNSWLPWDKQFLFMSPRFENKRTRDVADNEHKFQRVSVLFCSVLGCVLPLLEVALSQSPPTFSVLCYPCPYRSLLPHNVIFPTMFWSSSWSYTLCLPLCASDSPSIIFIFRAMCPAHFHFILVTYWTMSVTLVLCLIMVLGILSISLTLSIFLSMAWYLIARMFSGRQTDGGFKSPRGWTRGTAQTGSPGRTAAPSGGGEDQGGGPDSEETTVETAGAGTAGKTVEKLQGDSVFCVEGDCWLAFFLVNVCLITHIYRETWVPMMYDYQLFLPHTEIKVAKLLGQHA